MATKKAERPQKSTRTIATNRKAFFDYEILDRYEAGLVLTGTEIKSIRAGKVDLRDAYARPQNGELWLVTLVALSIFIKGHVAKVGLGLARGKRQYDKRRSLMNKDLDREARRALGTVR